MPRTVIDFEEKWLERLAPSELSHHLMRLPAKKRLEMILQREDAEQVVAALAEQDFYFSVKEIGPEDALALLGMARVEQLNHIFDLEWWHKDQLQATKAVDWLDRLARANEDKLLKWLYYADFELLVTLFKRWIRVVDAPEDVDLIESIDQLPKNTLDDQYFWEPLYPQYEDFFKQLLGVIFEVHYGFYKELMDHIISSIDSEIEEDAYRFHIGRLEDLAIPDFYDALHIYRQILPDEIASTKPIFSSESSSPAPSFALAVVPDTNLFGRALELIAESSLISSLQLELASLANKVVVADQIAPDNTEALHLAVDKAAAYVNLGLHLTGGDSPEIAAKNVRELFLEHLFRLAQASIAGLKQKLQLICRQGWISRWPKKLNCLDQPWMESAELLLERTPRIIREAAPEQMQREDLFRTTEDLRRAEFFVETIGVLGKVFDLLAPKPEYLQLVLWQQGQIRDLADLTVGNMLWTASARFLSEAKWRVEPISVKSWTGIFPLLGAQKIHQTLRQWIEHSLGESDAVRMEAYLSPLLKEYEEEMAPFNSANPPDASLVKFFLFKE